MHELLGHEVKIGNKNGEITNILGVGYEITFSIQILEKYLYIQEIFVII